MPSVNLGRIGMIARGVYSPAERYNRLDVVAYNGAAYCALKSVTGVTPADDGVSWVCMVNSRSIESAAINAAGELIIFLNDGTYSNLGVVKGKDAEPLTAQLIADTLGYTPASAGSVTGLAADLAAMGNRVNAAAADASAVPALRREVSALMQLNQGITYRFETDDAAIAEKAVPTGAMLASINGITGRSIPWNQLGVNPALTNASGITLTNAKADYSSAGARITYTSASLSQGAVSMALGTSLVVGHRYIMFCGYNASNPDTRFNFSVRGMGTQVVTLGTPFVANSESTLMRINFYDWQPNDYVDIRRWQLIDLTSIFGSSVSADQLAWVSAYAARHIAYDDGSTISAAVERVEFGNTSVPVPQAVRELDGYGSEGYSLERADSLWRFTGPGVSRDVTQLIGSIFDSLTVRAGDTIRFISDSGLDMGNSVEYLVRLEAVT